MGFEPQSPEAGSISQNFVSQFPTVPDVPFHKVIGPSIESLQETSQHAANVDTNSRLKISNAQSHTEEAGNRVPIERPQTERRRIVPEIIGNDATISFGEGQSPPDRLASISELSSTTQSPQYSTTCRICRRGFKSLENLRLHSKSKLTSQVRLFNHLLKVFRRVSILYCSM